MGKKEKERKGYLLFDVNLWQALQLGGMFWYICEQKNKTWWGKTSSTTIGTSITHLKQAETPG